MGYGEYERRYAEPFANALVARGGFRSWVIAQTEFANFAGDARLLHEEMKRKRSAAAQTWWRSHFSEACRCDGCSGQETDLLAIFETSTRFRFALHVEVKHPTDRFKGGGRQSRGYPLRARCWSIKPPAAVLPHHLATTVLLYSAAKHTEYDAHLGCFGALITFEALRANFPHATAA
jgi:hypothetical protein